MISRTSVALIDNLDFYRVRFSYSITQWKYGLYSVLPGTTASEESFPAERLRQIDAKKLGFTRLEDESAQIVIR